MSFGWVGSGYECMNGHFKMEILKTSFHDINPHLMHLFYPQISTHSRMFRTNSSAGGWVWNCVAPEKGMNVKTLITPPLTHVRTHSLQSSSVRASPFCPHCLTWSYSAAWTQHVSWKDGRSQLTHCGPPPHKSSLSHSSPGLSERKHRTALCTDMGPYKKSADLLRDFLEISAGCCVCYIFFFFNLQFICGKS